MINQESADSILNEMKKDQKKYGIQTTVSFAQEGMSFEPAKSEFITQFEKILQDMQSVTEEVSRVISHPDFHQFIHGLISDSGPRFRAIVERSEDYGNSKSTIQARISQDFDDLQIAVDKFSACRDVDDFDRTFVFLDWKETHSDMESIRDLMQMLGKWDGDIVKKIKPQESKGLILVQGRKLAARLSTRVKEEQTNMREYLMDLAKDKATDITHQINDIKKIINQPPATLSSYVEYVNKLDMCSLQLEGLREEKKKLEDMKSLISKHRSKDEGYPNVAQSTLQSKIEALHTEITEVQGSIDKANAETEGQKEANVEELEKKLI